MKLAFVGIFKNEAASICDLLASVRGVCDRWTVIDTGSTDVTKDLIQAIQEDVPGKLYDEPFVDFGTTRNRALDLEAESPDHADFALMLSGDEVLKGGKVLREYLEQHPDIGAVNIEIRAGDSRWLYPRVTRVGGPWRYEGKVHESVLNRVDGLDGNDLDTVPGVWIEHIVRDPERRALDIFENHVPLLRGMVAENPDDPRALMLLGQSLADVVSIFEGGAIRTVALEAMSYYLRRLAIDPCPEDEKNFAMLRYLVLAEQAGVYLPGEMIARLDDLCNDAPDLPEAHLLRASAISRVQPILKVLSAASQAADVAREVRGKLSRFPRDATCEWKACLLASMAANRASKYDPKYNDEAQVWARRCEEAGGPPVKFEPAVETVTEPAA